MLRNFFVRGFLFMEPDSCSVAGEGTGSVQASCLMLTCRSGLNFECVKNRTMMRLTTSEFIEDSFFPRQRIVSQNLRHG